MSTATAGHAMARKKTGGTGGGEGGGESKTTVKLDAALHRRAKAVAAWQGLDLADYLDAILRPAVNRDFQKMAKDAGQAD